MSDFNLFKPSAEALFWYEVASFAAPYATVGSFLLSAVSFANQDNHEERLAEISRKLDEIKLQIREMKRSIEEKLNDIPAKERSGEVVGIAEILREYRIIQSKGIIDNLITDSAQTKGKIEAYIKSSDTPISYRALYFSLYVTLLPFRASAFKLYDIPKDKINTLVAEELNQLLSFEKSAIETVRTVGANRVSDVKQERFLFDELGPVFGTEFFLFLDNKRRSLGTFIPRHGSLTEIRQNAHKIRENLANEKANEAAQTFEKCFTDTRGALNSLN